ncbi:DUF2179 domain-containing protein [bacterium]|nr:MAG: DUF2179 domain-containing protein [bacterium]
MFFIDSIPSSLVPLLIFASRILDVSMGTIRIIFVNRGMKGVAAGLGFFEVFIWITVVAQIISNMDHWMNYIAYAGGFATGNYIGILIEQKLKVGTQVFRIITQKDPSEFIKLLDRSKLRSTVLKAQGTNGEENVVFTVVKRKQAGHVMKWIKQFDAEAFYSIEDVKFASDGSSKSINNAERTPFMQVLSTRKSV